MGKEQKENNLETRNDKLYEAAICFARMWGIHETLEPLPNLGFDRIGSLFSAGHGNIWREGKKI